jgi:hypothetical protein
MNLLNFECENMQQPDNFYQLIFISIKPGPASVMVSLPASSSQGSELESPQLLNQKEEDILRAGTFR